MKDFLLPTRILREMTVYDSMTLNDISIETHSVGNGVCLESAICLLCDGGYIAETSIIEGDETKKAYKLTQKGIDEIKKLPC